MPVGTRGTVKGHWPEDVRETGAQMVLANTYHLALRPGPDVVEALGGLHEFMQWDGPILTDSGGFQIFSLAQLANLTEEGVSFKSHIDGAWFELTPERAIGIQEQLGADCIMCLDECPSHEVSIETLRNAVERTTRWATRCREAQTRDDQALFGIVQGGAFSDLRDESARHITEIPFPGYAIGGLAVGESKAELYQVAGQVAVQLPQDKPRYLMGVGSPEDLVECVARGVDMFDCVLPTRVARNGALFTRTGRVDITKRRYANQTEPLDEDCDCHGCRNFSAAYLWHLFKAKELLALRLATMHNLRFILRLMKDMREAILENRFADFQREFWDAYHPTDERTRQTQKDKWLKARGG